ncbi:MAG: SEC-C domain-containing protein [Alphaproteobacteria bacterium]|nr:SEC-C domain-containing protein [Alphaproteobacteria bacterium]
MIDKVSQSESALRQNLETQKGFLKRTADAFDAGHEDEALRLATTLRVLLHDTNNSHSIIKQLDMKGGKFIDTADAFNPSNMAPHGGLVYMALDASRARYIALLDNASKITLKDFESWWNDPVFVDKNGQKLTRQNLVLIAANQAGGAHVDPAIDSRYAKLDTSLGHHAFIDNVKQELGNPSRAAIRQIAHEVLKTLDPTYSKKPNHGPALIMGQISLTVGSPASRAANQQSTLRVGRNALCPCGSGIKYKKCHGRPF